MNAASNFTEAKVEAIFDGYTLDGYIGAVTGVHGDLTFTYRPLDLITSRRLAVQNRMIANNPSLSEDDKEISVELLEIESVLKCIKSWTLTDAAGNPAPLDVHSVLKYFPRWRADRLFSIVAAGGPSDPRPDAKPSAAPEQPAANDLDASLGNSAAA